MVILATGYTQTFPFLPPSDGTYHTPETCNTRDIWHSTDPTVGFIGFVRVPPSAPSRR